MVQPREHVGGAEGEADLESTGGLVFLSCLPFNSLAVHVLPSRRCGHAAGGTLLLTASSQSQETLIL